MQPSAYPVEVERLKQNWHTYIKGGPGGWADNGLVDPAVLRSWQRCSFRLDPLAQPRPNRVGENALSSIQRSQGNLTSVATPIMEDIFQFTEGSGCAILLADGTACVHTLIGDSAAIRHLEEAGMDRGTYWSEGQLGTNALGMVLFEAMPILVVGPEHYAAAYHDLSSVAAPIHDVRGRIVGIIGIIGPSEAGSSHTLALVMAAARAISNQLQTDWYINAANLHLSEVNTVLGAISEGIIAWNEAGKIVRSQDLEAQNAGTGRYVWDGKDDLGNEMTMGNYTFDVEAFDIEDNPVNVITKSLGRVTDIAFEDGITYLVLDGNKRVFLSDIESVGL